jgi:phosphoribosylanthranilate isomerase
MTQVKICGITNIDDALVAAKAGADFLGFIFYKPSPRYVALESAKTIISEIKNSATFSPLCVGVFVNEDQPTVNQILEVCQLDAVQLHGNESPEFVNRFGGRAFKALRPQSTEEADVLVQKYAGNVRRSAVSVQRSTGNKLPHLLLDAYHPDLYGGTDHITDWTMAAKIARQHRVMLAGSLTPANVRQAIRAVRPWGVDVSSGVELTKGKKDHGKVREFIRAAKGAD